MQHEPVGHLEAYDEALKRWAMEQLPMIPERWRVEVKPQTAAQFNVVKALIAKTTHVTIATDADREGELIAREILDLCGYRGPIERLRLSARNDASTLPVESGKQAAPRQHQGQRRRASKSS